MTIVLHNEENLHSAAFTLTMSLLTVISTTLSVKFSLRPSSPKRTPPVSPSRSTCSDKSRAVSHKSPQSAARCQS